MSDRNLARVHVEDGRTFFYHLRDRTEARASILASLGLPGDAEYVDSWRDREYQCDVFILRSASFRPVPLWLAVPAIEDYGLDPSRREPAGEGAGAGLALNGGTA